MVSLTPELVENFAGVFLSPRYDNPTPTAPFHREAWGLYCSDVQLAAVAAPREHAKSTALTHNFGLATVLFRFEPHVMLIGSSEDLAMTQLGDITKELKDNDDLRAEFGIKKFLVESKGEIIVLCDDGYEFRILARGVEQRVRGIKWNGRRPGLILGDDIEEDEQVENSARRRKLARWINRALIPMGRKGCRVRIHGTILHQDSFLAQIIHGKGSEWKSLFYKAHASFDDFTQILWPGMFDEARLRTIRQRFIASQDSGGYSQEYLNDPQDNDEAYLRKDYFRPAKEEHLDSPMVLGVGIDFAISKGDAANRTCFAVVGKTAANQMVWRDVRVGRMDSEEIFEEFFSINERWRPEFYWVESGQIWLSLRATLYKEMMKRNTFLNIIERTPLKDKAARARPWQMRMKAGACFFDKEAEWYPPYEEECLRFTTGAEARLDDQFDASATAVLGFENLHEVEDEDVMSEDEWAAARFANESGDQGRSRVTGY